MVRILVIDFMQNICGCNYYIILLLVGIIRYHIILRYVLAVLRLLCAL